jgi:hypothetical protein
MASGFPRLLLEASRGDEPVEMLAGRLRRTEVERLHHLTNRWRYPSREPLADEPENLLSSFPWRRATHAGTIPYKCTVDKKKGVKS